MSLSKLAATPGALLHACARRAVHNDVHFPNFDAYRREDTKDPTRPSRDTENHRKGIPHFIFYGVGGALAVLTGKHAIQTIANYKSMPADQLAMEYVQIDLTLVPEGQTKTFEWRGMPLFVMHRTAEQIDAVRATPLSDLRDPQRDEDRVKKPEYSVLVGICTHLGCVPKAGKGGYGGYLCYCHGSHYDASGRIRRGPAPLNLKVPKYEFITDELIRVG